MKRNVDLNGLGLTPAPPAEGMDVDPDSTVSAHTARKEERAGLGKVRINEGDAW
jgi:hypothetical protein